MAKRNTSIQINGKRYDALTGSLVSHPSVTAPGAKSIDGVVNGSAAAPKQPLQALPASQVPRSQAAHARAHQVKPSGTLMRHAVAKPTSSGLKRRVKVQASTLSAMSVPATAQVASKESINKHRMARAAQVNTSPRVARFAHQLVSQTPTLVEQVSTELENNFEIPVMPTTQTYRVEVNPQNAKRVTSDIFEQALARATSHEEPTPVMTTKRRRALAALRTRMATYGAVAVVVLVVGMLVSQQVDTFKFKMESSRTGFAATMPSYRPAGFDVSQVQAQSGYFGLNFTNPNEPAGLSHSFALTERPSPWNSETLLANILASPTVSSYSTVQAAGRTVYVYGQNQAAWVNNGVVYQILGNGLLNTQEFSKIAASM